MRKPRTRRPLTNEIKYPYIVELPVSLKELDAELNRKITAFHTLRNIRVRHGRQIAKENKMYFRWCFPDLTTADAFVERFGGTVHKRLMPDEARRIASNIAKLPELVRVTVANCTRTSNSR